MALNRRIAFFCSAAAAALTAFSGARAQDANTAGAEEDDVIVVTAQRRAQNVLDVPIAINALSAETLRETGVVEVKDLTFVAPSVNITSSTSEGAGAVFRIRGVGTTGQNAGLEGSVGVFLDGVYLARPGTAMNDLIDVERVEVLRGPQGTLFGKNTSSGAISIVTKKPEFEFGGEADVTVGSDGIFRARGTVTGPLIEDVLAIRLSGGRNQRDGVITDFVSGEEYNDRDRYNLRGQALFTPSETFEARLIVDYSEKNEACCAAPFSFNGPRATNIAAIGGTVLPDDENRREVAVDTPFIDDAEDFGVSLQMDWETPVGDLVSITSYRDFQSVSLADTDRTDAAIATASRDIEDTLITQELRLQGEQGRLSWLVGAYYFTEDLSETSMQVFGADTEAYVLTLVPASYAPVVIGYYDDGFGSFGDFDQDTTGWAIFTHNDLTITEKLHFIFGARWNDEEKDGRGVFADTTDCGHPVRAAVNFLCPAGDFDASESYEEMTGIATLQYFLTDDLNVYASYARGFKAGGINLHRDAYKSTSGGETFLPETVDNFEIGAKGLFFDKRLQVTTAGYYAEFDNFQLNTFTGNGFIISNAAGVISTGAELDAQWRVAPGFILRAGAAFNESEYTTDTDNAGLTDLQITNAPKWSISAGGGYERAVSSGLEAFASVNASYQSRVRTGSDLDPMKDQEGYARLNARAGVRDADGRWELALWGENILDEDYRLIVIDTPAQAGSYNAFLGTPAFYGATFSVSF